MTPVNDAATLAGRRAPPRLRACRGSRACSWRSGTGRRRSGSGRGRRSPGRATVKSGAVSPITQVIDSSSAMRMNIASDSPTLRARSRSSGAQLSGQDRDEDDVVDAEDDLEDRQGQEGDPALGARHPVEHHGLLRRVGAVPASRGRVRQRAPGFRVLPDQRREIERHVLGRDRPAPASSRPRCSVSGVGRLHAPRRRSARPRARCPGRRGSCPSSAAGAPGDRRRAAARPRAPTRRQRDAAAAPSSRPAAPCTLFGAELDPLRDGGDRLGLLDGRRSRRARTLRPPAACARGTAASRVARVAEIVGSVSHDQLDTLT